MTKDEALRMALEALENNKLNHLYCEDTWYSCPKHEDGCANEAEGDECNCGADEVNAQFDNAITAIKEALAQEQEPVGWFGYDQGASIWFETNKGEDNSVPLYTTPPQLEQEHFALKHRIAELEGAVIGLQAQLAQTERPVDCERCNRLEEQAYDLVGKLRVANIKLSMQPQRTWVGLTEEQMMDCDIDEDGFVTSRVWAKLNVQAKLKKKNSA